MSDVFREVDEDLRNEQLTNLWRRFGALAIGAALLVVAGVAGFKGWTWYTNQQAEDAGLRYEQAVAASEDGNQAEGIRQMELIARSAPGGYPALAALEIAGLKAQAGDIDGAVAAYDAFAADSSNEQNLRNVAILQSAYYLLDTADTATIRTRLENLASSEGVWQASAREVIALSLWKAGSYAEAAGIFREISSDFQAPRGVRQRSLVMLNLIAPDEQAAGVSGAENNQ